MGLHGERRIWWSYMGTLYDECRSLGSFVARDVTADCFRDLVLFERKRIVCAVGRVLAPARPVSPTGTRWARFGDPIIWQVPVEFTELPGKLHYQQLKAQGAHLDERSGPLRAPTGSGTRGYFYPTSPEVLELVLRLTGAHLPLALECAPRSAGSDPAEGTS